MTRGLLQATCHDASRLLVSLLCLQAAREVAHTIAESSNKVYLNSESLLLNVVGTGSCWCVSGY